MAHKRLKQQSFHDSPPAQSRFSTLPAELKLKVLEYFSFEELHSRFSTLPIELKHQILDYFSFEELHSRFSTLPIELKVQILDYFSFEEAAKTSILSSILSSTSNWSEHSQVILDKLLFEERGRWIALHPSAWVNKVNEILTNHREGLIPIQKFILHIPDMQYKWGLYIDIWLSYLSSNSIKELSVDNWNITTYKFSAILFKFSELTQLTLRNCAFYEPRGSFQNLRFLHLEKIAFDSVKVGAVTISAPSLVRSELVDCTGFQYLNIHAPEVDAVTISVPSLVQLELVDCTGLQYLNSHAPKLRNFVVRSSDGLSPHDVNQMSLKLGISLEEETVFCRNCGTGWCLGRQLPYAEFFLWPWPS